MSTSISSSSQVGLEVFTANPATEIYVIDGQFKLACRGRGHLAAQLDPGIYSIKVRAGLVTQEEDVLLLGPKVVKSYSVAFPTTAPLAGTTMTDEAHCQAAREQSRKVHSRIGEGSSIFLFARDWHEPSLKPEELKSETAHPAKGLRLTNVKGDVLIDYSVKSELSSSGKPWAACNAQIEPGSYLLSLQMSDGTTLERTVVAAKGWQTQIFLLQEDYERSEKQRLPDLSGASMHLAREYFEPDNLRCHLIELVRTGMANKRQVLPLDLIRELSRGKFEEPLLGLFAAHIFLDRRPRLQMLRPVVARLRTLLGYEHPDVEALALLLGDENSSYIFDAPPMLRRSWPLILKTTGSRVEIVPTDSLISRVAYQFCGEEPWLIWRNQPEQHSEEFTPETAVVAVQQAALELIDTTLKLFFDTYQKVPDSAQEAVGFEKTWRNVKDSAGQIFDGVLQFIFTLFFRAGPSLEIVPTAVSVSSPTPGKKRNKERVEHELGEEEIKKLVQALGIPRANLEVLLKKKKKEEAQGSNPETPVSL